MSVILVSACMYLAYSWKVVTTALVINSPCKSGIKLNSNIIILFPMTDNSESLKSTRYKIAQYYVN